MKEIPVRYVLYSHYGATEDSDMRAYKGGAQLEELPGFKHLQAHLRGLRELLTTPGHEGMLVLFYYAPALLDFLRGIEHGSDEQRLLSDSEGLRFAEAVGRCVTKLLEQNQLADRVRFLTPIDLKVILGQAHAILAEKFQLYFVGPARGIRYDTPKIVESIIRLRLLGNGLPVLRVDSDVLFRFGAGIKVIGDLGLFKAVACATRAYHLRLADHTVSTFLFSSSYNSRALRESDSEVDRFEAWSRAFATRVHPALVVDPKAVSDIMAQPLDQQDNGWNEYVKSHLDDKLVRQFFGLRDGESTLEPDGINGITAIGAHPFFAVISGALLCLSEGAIIDLPPFSNFTNNVMWIDDHLKYSLHRSLDHFTSGETLNLEPGLSDARLDEVNVTKGRPAVSKLPQYVLGSYLPTLLWGCVMDSWITVDPILKCRVSVLRGDEKERWRDARSKEKTAPLPKAILAALQRGHFDYATEQQLREELRTYAIERIENVRQMWARLQRNKRKTFACVWAEGNVRKVFPLECFKNSPNRLWEGITNARELSDPIKSLEDLAGPVAERVRELIDDAVTYVHWLLDWPKFIQIVRSVPQGTFCGDMSWRMDKP